MKSRSLQPLPRLGDQRAPSSTQPRTGGGAPGGGQRSKFPEGMFEHFYAGPIPIWINISPNQSFTQEVYDRATKEVIETTTTWWESTKHYCAFNVGAYGPDKKPLPKDFRCSSGAYKACPCWGCVLIQQHWDKMNAIEEKTGVRPGTKPPVGRIPQYAFGITIMENMYSIPMLDGNGKIRKDKKGRVLFRHTPAPRAEEEQEAATLMRCTVTKGHRAHWELGSQELGYLLEQDNNMRKYCGNCASDMYCSTMICPGCETPHNLKSRVSKTDLDLEVQKTRTCSLCGEKGSFVPVYECDDCGVPVEGALTAFDIRVRRIQSGTNYILEIVGIRVPGVPDSTQEDFDRIRGMIQNPLKVNEIYAPTDLPRQAMICGDRIKGLSLPDAPAGGETESYADDDGNINFKKS